MKKILLLILSVVLTLTLSACGDDPIEDFEYNVPKENVINIQELAYAEYLSLKNPVVTITVENIGVIKLQLFPDLAPISVDNFIHYIQDGAYDGTEFHRVVDDFMIQGGVVEEPECNILGEFSNNGVENALTHYMGVLSMARANDYNSASSQWFIVEYNSSYLDTNYAAFGGMISGFNVLTYIASLQVEDTEVPVVPVVVESITVDLKDYTPGERVCYTE